MALEREERTLTTTTLDKECLELITLKYRTGDKHYLSRSGYGCPACKDNSDFEIDAKQLYEELKGIFK